jgi:hypothetical protein
MDCRIRNSGCCEVPDQGFLCWHVQSQAPAIVYMHDSATSRANQHYAGAVRGSQPRSLKHTCRKGGLQAAVRVSLHNYYIWYISSIASHGWLPTCHSALTVSQTHRLGRIADLRSILPYHAAAPEESETKTHVFLALCGKLCSLLRLTRSS